MNTSIADKKWILTTLVYQNYYSDFIRHLYVLYILLWYTWKYTTWTCTCNKFDDSSSYYYLYVVHILCFK